MSRPVQHRGGFTIIELLVVVTIISVLISLLLPSVSKAVEQSKRMKCMANLRQQCVCARVYAAEQGGNLPYQPENWGTNPLSSDNAVNWAWFGINGNVNGWGALVYNGYTPLTILDCPSANLSQRPFYWTVKTTVLHWGPVKTIPAQSLVSVGANALWTCYGYRFNSADLSDTMANIAVPSPYPTGNAITGLHAYDASRFGNLPLFHEAWALQMADDNTDAIFPSWGHYDGGNVALFDGSAKWLANVIQTPTGNYRMTNWPARRYVPDYGGTGATAGLDYWVSR